MSRRRYLSTEIGAARPGHERVQLGMRRQVLLYGLLGGLLIAGLRFVVLHTKGGAVKWFKVQPTETSGA